MTKPKETTAEGQTKALSFELELKHPPEKVWRALTEPALIAKWLLPVLNDALPLERGAHFTLKAAPQPGWDGLVNARFLEIEPTRRLSYAWVVGDLDTVVTFTLTPTATGTTLAMMQTGFDERQKRNFHGARYGWNMMSERLAALFEQEVM